MTNESKFVAAQQAFSSRINVINEIAIDANRSLDVEEILCNAARKARWLLDFDHASAFLQQDESAPWDETALDLYMRDQTITASDIFALALRQKAIARQQPQVLPQASIQSPQRAEQNVASQTNGYATPYPFQMIIPLQSEGQVLGTLNFASAQHAYSGDDMRIGYLLALLLSGAIRSARRFAEMRQLYANLEEAYSRLKQTEQRRDSLTSMIVHDLRNPLMTVLGTLELLEDISGELGTDAMVEETIRRARRAGRRMTDQISDLIDVNKFEDGALRPRLCQLTMKQLLKPHLSDYEAQARDEEKTFTPMLLPTLPPFLADPELIGRVLDNLVTNAFKYTRCGGHVSLCAAAGAEQITITVSDDGIGVPPAQREQIFDKYGQVSDDEGRPLRKGSGLGLTYCRMAVEAHGGRIWVDSNRPQGSIFAFTLPLAG